MTCSREQTLVTLRSLACPRARVELPLTQSTNRDYLHKLDFNLRAVMTRATGSAWSASTIGLSSRGSANQEDGNGDLALYGVGTGDAPKEGENLCISRSFFLVTQEPNRRGLFAGSGV